MTDRIALWLGLIILALAGLDLAIYDTTHLLVLGVKFVDFVDYIAFWR